MPKKNISDKVKRDVINSYTDPSSLEYEDFNRLVKKYNQISESSIRRILNKAGVYKYKIKPYVKTEKKTKQEIKEKVDHYMKDKDNGKKPEPGKDDELKDLSKEFNNEQYKDLKDFAENKAIMVREFVNGYLKMLQEGFNKNMKPGLKATVKIKELEITVMGDIL